MRNDQNPGLASRRNWIALGTTGIGATALGAASFLRGRERAAPPPSTGAWDRLPDVPLVTHEGRSVRFYSDLVRGRIVFINMMYAQCSNRCPPMTQNLKRVHELLGERAGKDVFMYSLSLQPEFDRPQDLRAYMKINGVQAPGWTFLTGAKEHVERLRRSLGFYDRDPAVDGDISQHTGMVRIGNDALDRWCMTPALYPPEKIAATLLAIDPVARAAGKREA